MATNAPYCLPMSSSDNWFIEEARRRNALDEAKIELYSITPEVNFVFRGLVQVTGTASSADTDAVDKVLHDLRQQALEKGANGVIGVRIEHSHSDVQQSLFITAYGDAVIFPDDLVS